VVTARPRAILAAMLAIPAITIALAGVAASSSPAAPPPSITLSAPLPSVVRVGSTLTVSGHVRHARAATRAQLWLGRSTTWSPVAATPIRRGGFTLSWQVPSSQTPGLVSFRLSARSRRGVLARTKPVQSAIGPAPVLCAAPEPPAVNIPVGDGWIVGGRYNVGGPFPGIDVCDGDQYTVTATDPNGIVQATQTVAGGHSYTLVVPAGQYTLNSDFCRGTATVASGQQTQADTICAVP
jgi:hypothetical protein